MRRALNVVMVVAFAFFFEMASAWACEVRGRVVCTGTETGVAGAIVTLNDNGREFQGVTGADGSFSMNVYAGATFAVNIDLTAAGGQAAVSGGTVVVPADAPDLIIIAEPFQVDVPGCVKTGCWLTGGGAKFSTVTGTNVAEHGPQVSMGGNVNPSCSPEPGQGGQWNHVDHRQKLHFQGLAIVVKECGNVPGIPPGSTSPVTPNNYIEFYGTGVLKGIAGNKYGPAEACFEARAEDRNEPGSSGQRDGTLIDRYFIRVFDCSSDATLLYLENAATPEVFGDPVAITDGNLQLHISSCTP